MLEEVGHQGKAWAGSISYSDHNTCSDKAQLHTAATAEVIGIMCHSCPQ